VSEPLPGRGTPASQEERRAAVHGFLDATDATVPGDRAINAALRRVMERALCQPSLPVDRPAAGRPGIPGYSSGNSGEKKGDRG
jgi:hypothetical protein